MSTKTPATTQTAVQKEAMAISADMRELYSNFKSQAVDRGAADTLANIAGKNLKALALVVADQLREDGHLQIIAKTRTLEHEAQ